MNLIKTVCSAAVLGMALSSMASHAEDFSENFTKLGADLTDKERSFLKEMLPGYPEPKDDELVHISKTMEDLEEADIHPKLKEAIKRGYDLFTDTQQLRGKYVFNDMNCSSCHTGDGARPFSGPVWPALVTLPDYRGKNDHVNNFEERIAGCFAYSMNGKPPAYGSDEMVALTAYHQWLAKGVEMYPDADIYGRGYPRLDDPEREPDYKVGRQVYKNNCAICHAEDGSGKKADGQIVFPPLWGDTANNWGAGISRVYTMAAFVKYNMPLGSAMSLSDQEAWDVAEYVNSHERPQDPRYTGDYKETLDQFNNFLKHTNYGKEVEGKILGDHDNTGEKPFMKPDSLKSRDFSGKNTEG